MEELNSGPPKTNPSSGREEDLNPGPPDSKSSALPLGHARLPNRQKQKYFCLLMYKKITVCTVLIQYMFIFLDPVWLGHLSCAFLS